MAKQIIKISALEVNFIKGKCFLCGDECALYVHSSCALVYTDKKELFIKQKLKEEELKK